MNKMWSKIYALTRRNTDEVKNDQLVPFVQVPRPVDIARKNNDIIKVKYKEYMKEQYKQVRDNSIKVGRLYFALALDSSYYDNDCFCILKKLAYEDGYKVVSDSFVSKYLVFYAPGESYDRDFLCNRSNPNYFVIGDVKNIEEVN